MSNSVAIGEYRGEMGDRGGRYGAIVAASPPCGPRGAAGAAETVMTYVEGSTGGSLPVQHFVRQQVMRPPLTSTPVDANSSLANLSIPASFLLENLVNFGVPSPNPSTAPSTSAPLTPAQSDTLQTPPKQ